METPLQRITRRVQPFLAEDTFDPRPLLTLEEFFDGNDDEGSIWCNLSLPGPVLPRAREVLSEIRGRPDVADVRVALTMFDNPEWPFADTVLVVTDRGSAEVRGWFDPDVAPDDTWRGDEDASRFEDTGVDLRRTVVCWWD